LILSFEPLYNAGPLITVHAFAALAAFGLGTAQLALPKGTSVHRAMGYIWITLMAAVAISSFWIHDLRLIGPFSPIHLLSVYSLGSIVVAIRTARQGNIAAHKSTVKSLYFLALIGAGAFTLLPGRVMHEVVFG
jgi:uncharacterized membrane protein